MSKNKKWASKKTDKDAIQDFQIPASIKDLFHLFKDKNLTGEILRGSLGSFGLKLAHLIVAFSSSIILARLLGVEEYGIFTYAIAIVSIFSIPTQLGMPKLLIRFIAKYQISEEWDKLKGLLKWSNISVLSISLTITFLIMFYVWVQYEIPLGRKAETLFWSSILVPILSLGALRGGALRGLRYVVRGLAPELVIRKLILIVFLLIWSFMITPELDAPFAMICNVFAAIIAFILGAFWLWKRIPKPVFEAEVKYDSKKWIIVALPFLITGGMSIINNKIDIIMLGWLREPAEVGVYDIAVKVSQFVPFSLTAINLVLAPYFTRFYSQTDLKKLQKICSYGVLTALIIAVPVGITFIIFGAEILHIVFGIEFLQGYLALVLLVIGQIINVAAGSVGILLNMTNYEKLVLNGMAFAATINIILNLLLIPIFGMEGAAGASLLTFTTWNGILVYYSKKYLKIDPSITSIIKILRS